MHYIEHYTEGGDIVLDGFCGTGMTGVAAQLLGRKAILSDLSPIATFIAYNYNNPVDILAFEKEAKQGGQQMEAEFEHFSWNQDATKIIGLTIKGHCTIKELKLNREKLVEYRNALIPFGVHPPKFVR